MGFTDTGEGGGELWEGGWGGVPEFSSGSLLWLPGCLSRPCPFAAASPRALRGSQHLQMWRMRSLSPPPSAAPDPSPLCPLPLPDPCSGVSDPSTMTKRTPSFAMPAVSVNTLASTSCSTPSPAAQWTPLRTRKTVRR